MVAEFFEGFDGLVVTFFGNLVHFGNDLIPNGGDDFVGTVSGAFVLESFDVFENREHPVLVYLKFVNLLDHVNQLPILFLFDFVPRNKD